MTVKNQDADQSAPLLTGNKKRNSMLYQLNNPALYKKTKEKIFFIKIDTSVGELVRSQMASSKNKAENLCKEWMRECQIEGSILEIIPA